MPKRAGIKISSREKPASRPAAVQKPAVRQTARLPAKTEGQVQITPEIRRLWIRMRQAWVVSYDAFNRSVEVLDDRQADLIYEVVKHSLFKGSHAEILRAHPELRPLLQTDDDRLCMHDIYERLSFRLNRYEKPPPDRAVYRGMKGSIGRNVPDLQS